MSTSQAIIELVVTNSAQVEQTNEKIQGDLTALERSAKSAEAGARSAETAARSISDQIPGILSKLRQGLHLLERAAKAAGLDADSKGGIVFDEAGQVASETLQGARTGYRLGGPEGAAAGAVLAAAVSLNTAIDRGSKRLDELAERLESKHQDEVLDALFREAGLDKIDQTRAPQGRRIR